MNCEQVQSLLLAYLDGEITPSERALTLAHLSGCSVCQQELDLLSTARSRVRSALQRRAVHATPSREAWSRLEARLPKVQETSLPEAAQPSSKFAAWFSRKAPSASRAFNQLLGGVTMQKRWIFSGLAGVIVLSVLAVLVAKNVTPVSAREILDRAYEVQAQQAADQGIQHVRSEIYSNLETLPEDQGMDTIVESYFDPESGKLRVVTTDNKSGKVLNVSAFDGSYSYTQVSDKEGRSDDSPLTIYRSPQTNVGNQKPYPRSDDLSSKSMFDMMSDDPNVQFVGQETWEDGRTVYVLRSEQPIKLLVADEMQHSIGLVTVYFEVGTYKLVGNRVTMEKDGKELLISSQRILMDEILPAESNVAWDLSDLQGVTIVDDPNGEHSVPEVIPPEFIPVEVLASKTQSAYLLKTVPDGFSLEVTVLSRQPANE